jgi:hypothetical protein
LQILAWPIQPLTAITANASFEAALCPELKDGSSADVEALLELLAREPAVLDHALLETLELCRETDPLNADCIECITRAISESKGFSGEERGQSLTRAWFRQ